MNVLLVDDEAVTRKGLCEHIAWEALGIDEVTLAEDGAHALAIASAKKPDILLTDIRMPHMDGIHLAGQILEKYPSCRIIFISGYSDKDYLKAAIRLKAIQYVEKPIVLEELTAALSEAVESIQEQRKKEQLVHIKSSPRQVLASSFLHELQPAEYQSAIKQADFSIEEFCSFITILIHSSVDLFSLAQEVFHSLQSRISDGLQQNGVIALPLMKRQDLLLYHLFLPKPLSDRQLKHILNNLIPLLESLQPFQIICGMPVQSARTLYQSYQSAVILMQNGFFFEKNRLLLYSEIEAAQPQALPENTEALFKEQLNQKNKSVLLEFADSVFHAFQYNTQMIPGRAKELYYKLLLEMYRILESRNLPVLISSGLLLDTINSCFTLEELHELFFEQLNAYLEYMASEESESELISLIKQYIQAHYSDESLSIQDISHYAAFSASYVCTVFKTETGTTLNQYITSFRMQKAKEFLSDPRNRITDISERVGYSDSNYFGKAFKKYTGLSPSEYREQVIS
ncbi:MAG: response regulator [Lachnospiraceae bacterium]|nr:response regulator [Lachnospiraceae bacterium]